MIKYNENYGSKDIVSSVHGHVTDQVSQSTLHDWHGLYSSMDHGEDKFIIRYGGLILQMAVL